MGVPLRVALIGAHGTGKTTLLRALLDRLQSLQIRAVGLPEAPREIIKRSNDPEFFRRGHNTVHRQMLILLVHLIQELGVGADVDIVIGDRSLLDHWAYARYLFSEELASTDTLHLYEEFIMQHCAGYDLLFLLPIEFDVVDDGTREKDGLFQREIEGYILDLVSKYNLQVLPVVGSVETRLEVCLEAIQARTSFAGWQNVR